MSLIPLPASPLDVAAFLAQERDRGLAANTLDLRRAAIRFLHRAAGCPSPTEDAHVAETLAGIRRDAPNPIKKRAATLTVLRELLAPIPVDASAPRRPGRPPRSGPAAGGVRRRSAPLRACRHPGGRP